MENQPIEILNELKAISPALASLEKVNVFGVPEEYFSDLGQRILTGIFIHQDEKNNLQKIPQGYFDSLSNKILSKIKAEENESATEEIKALSPALYYLKEENIFRVPEKYFDDLSDRIIGQIKSEKTKVFSISSTKKWWRYAAAAVVAGVIIISSLQIFNHNSQSNNNKEIISKIYIQQAAKYKTPDELNRGIETLSDEEIVKYLETNGNILDEEAITKNLDVKELPDAGDYLIDENTLNNFLNKPNAENSSENIQ